MRGMICFCLALMISGLGLVGCGTMPTPSEDSSLAQAVLERLYQDNLIRRQGLGVSVTNGVVTLHGAITDETLRMRAKSIAESTPGVSAVQDQTTRR